MGLAAYLKNQGRGLVRPLLRGKSAGFGTLGAAIWPLHDIQAYMGHADISTTKIYVHHIPKIAAADELSRAVTAAMGGENLPNHLSKGAGAALNATETAN